MEPFATFEQLNARRPVPLAEADRGRATALLGDATTMLVSEMARAGVRWEGRTDEPFASALVTVACAMVNRAMDRLVLPEGLTQVSKTVGPYNVNVSARDGGLFVAAKERRMLGIGRARLGSCRPRIGYGGSDAR